VNRSPQDQSATIALPDAFNKTRTFDAFTSSESALWQSSTALPEAGKLIVAVPGYGVVTLAGKQAGG
jgi:hypothetical protein